MSMIRFDNVPPEIVQAMCTPMHQILLPPPAQHLGHLWLGSFAAISDADLLRKHRISHLVQVIDVPWLPPVNDPNMTVTRIDIMDIPSADLRSHLDDACARIERSLAAGKNVLVHCQQVSLTFPHLPARPLTLSSFKGISRSASVVIAYLIKNHGMSYEFAFAFVKKYRACIKPNSGFVNCLKEWEIKQRPHINRSQTECVLLPPPSPPPLTSHTDTQGNPNAALAGRNTPTGWSLLFGLHLGSYITSVSFLGLQTTITSGQEYSLSCL